MERNGRLGVIMDIKDNIQMVYEDPHIDVTKEPVEVKPEEPIKDMIAIGFLTIVVAVVIIMLLGAIYFTKGWLGISVAIGFVSFAGMLGWSLNRVAGK